MSKDVIGCRAREGMGYKEHRTRRLPVGSQRSLRGPPENGDGPSTPPVSKVPHLPGTEEGLESSSANQSPSGDQPHAPEPVGPGAPLIVP